ncbi:MAG: AN1-type zinc finger domain-containing protein [Candidatus Heimdallarchaeota archaeon]|nr:AN1-type zinc finger domain-containing protein [Candidatus Heimdallarchaeota archaeon]
MRSCSFLGCEEEEALPFKCKLCSQIFCPKHRLPEQHDCPRIGVYQSDEYKKSKLSPTREEKEKSKEGKAKKKKSKEKKEFYTARDMEMKSRFVEPQDRFLLRSSMFTLYTFKHNFLNILIASLYFIIIVGLRTLFDLTVIYKESVVTWPNTLLFLMVGYLISISLIYTGHMVIETIYAKKLGIRATQTLWLQGMLMGIISIVIPILMTPNFLVFNEYGTKEKERGKVALSGTLWILFWQFIVVVLVILEKFGMQIPLRDFYLGLEILAIFFFIYIIFSLIPFGFSKGRYIRSWKNKLFWYVLGFTIFLFITYIILMLI